MFSSCSCITSAGRRRPARRNTQRTNRQVCAMGVFRSHSARPLMAIHAFVHFPFSLLQESVWLLCVHSCMLLICSCARHITDSQHAPLSGRSSTALMVPRNLIHDLRLLWRSAELLLWAIPFSKVSSQRTIFVKKP